MTPRLLGHRGASAEYPENTLPSFERAVEIGVDVIETDVHLTADGEVVVSHDASGERAAGVKRPIAESTLAEVQRWDAGWGFRDAVGRRPFEGRGIQVPTLAEVLERFSEVRFNIDVKSRSPRLIERLLELLRARGDEDRVTLASFHADVMKTIRARGFRGTTALSRPEVVALVFLPELAARRLVRGQAAQIPLRVGRLELTSRELIDKCHRLGLWVDYWTVNDPNEADVLLDRGADGLISDDPARLAPIVRHYRVGDRLGDRESPCPRTGPRL